MISIKVVSICNLLRWGKASPPNQGRHMQNGIICIPYWAYPRIERTTSSLAAIPFFLLGVAEALAKIPRSQLRLERQVHFIFHH